MFINQLSVFVENREGSMQDIAKILKDNGIGIISFSLADTSEYGMLRLVVSKPELARDVLKQNGISAMITEVIAVRMEKGFANFDKLLNVMSQNELNIEYMYVLSTLKEAPGFVMKVTDLEKAKTVLGENNFKIYTFKELFE